MNYGAIVLEALLYHWQKCHQYNEDNEKVVEKKYIEIPDHTPIVFRYELNVYCNRYQGGYVNN